MLYQLIAYYTIHKGTKQTLWEYIAWTVIIFQNAALLEVSDPQKRDTEARFGKK